MHIYTTTTTTIAAAGQRASFNTLPDEVAQQILFFLSPYDTVLRLQPVSRRFHRLGNEPLLWRYHCRVQFKYWDANHRIKQKFMGNVGEVDWKLLYMHRHKVDYETTASLNSILEAQINRIGNFEKIGKFGYDAKDTLLRHCRTSDSAEDVLARK